MTGALVCLILMLTVNIAAHESDAPRTVRVAGYPYAVAVGVIVAAVT